MTKSEAQTRQSIINQRLKLCGWEVKSPLHVAEELDIWVGLPAGVAEPQSPYQGHLFADYVLLGKDGKPIAVVEAKKTSVDAEIGKEQARNYAQKIHEITAVHMPFVFYTNGYDIYFWDTERFPPRKILGFPSRSDLERMQFLRDNSKPLSSQLVDTKISGRPYQIEGIRAVLEAIEKRRRLSDYHPKLIEAHKQTALFVDKLRSGFKDFFDAYTADKEPSVKVPSLVCAYTRINTLMTAESKPSERDVIVTLVVNLINRNN